MGKHKTTFDERARWLANQPHIIAGWPEGPFTDQEIIKFMQVDGLISSKAHDFDLTKVIVEARRLIKLDKALRDDK